MQKVFTLLLLLTVLCIVGCNSNAQVDGTIMLSDGTPYTGGRIIYDKDSSSVIGRPDEKGYFRLYFEKPGSGVPAGSYRGFVSHDGRSPEEIASGGMMAKAPPPPFDRKYSDASTAGLSFEVKAGEKKKLEIVLDRAPQ